MRAQAGCKVRTVRRRAMPAAPDSGISSRNLLTNSPCPIFSLISYLSSQNVLGRGD